MPLRVFGVAESELADTAFEAAPELSSNRSPALHNGFQDAVHAASCWHEDACDLARFHVRCGGAQALNLLG
jgi:hypothetical protein